ncbi:MAG: hypothetical protein QTN59_11445 [Candidatus Electrothrix communis]|nr:MAG: hypothetical protein QTN59_11445 [Candidatus Electrothrix communis]
MANREEKGGLSLNYSLITRRGVFRRAKVTAESVLYSTLLLSGLRVSVNVIVGRSRYAADKPRTSTSAVNIL